MEDWDSSLIQHVKMKNFRKLGCPATEHAKPSRRASLNGADSATMADICEIIGRCARELDNVPQPDAETKRKAVEELNALDWHEGDLLKWRMVERAIRSITALRQTPKPRTPPGM
jgi:hypothetical protein